LDRIACSPGGSHKTFRAHQEQAWSTILLEIKLVLNFHVDSEVVGCLVGHMGPLQQGTLLKWAQIATNYALPGEPTNHQHFCRKGTNLTQRCAPFLQTPMVTVLQYLWFPSSCGWSQLQWLKSKGNIINLVGI